MTRDEGGAEDVQTTEEPRVQRKLEAYEAAIAELESAPAFAKANYQTQVHRLASELLDSDQGARGLLERAPRMAAAGTFHGGPWEKASRLLPRLVGQSLRGSGVYPTIEALSELRMVAIVQGRYQEEDIDAREAEQFLQEICVENLDLMYPEASEESRARPKIYARAGRLFALIRDNISVSGFGETLIDEIETICAQRPIVTRGVQRQLDLARQLPEGTLSAEKAARLQFFLRASGMVTPASEAAGTPQRYAEALIKMTPEERAVEIDRFAHSLHETGLSSPYHAILVRLVSQHEPQSLTPVLGLSPLGSACLGENLELVRQIIGEAIHPGTEVGVMGVAMTLNRGLVSRPEIRAGLRRLLRVKIVPTVEQRLQPLRHHELSVQPRALLIAGAVSVLGLPLGIGQGNNPTCQAARGLSLWSQYAPGFLLKILVRAVRDGVLHTGFEQHDLLIEEVQHESLDARLDLQLDPVSTVLVPLLDRLYAQILPLAQGRGDDPHRWVNPAMYGSWVPWGFRAAFDQVSGAVTDHKGFVRLFYATHHPQFNGSYELLYPNPVGIVITDVHANFLGYHAVSIQRIATSPNGKLRVYFFNPNNEGRQRWGQGVAPTVSGNGEQPGESSLPFHEFASRLYAYHYDRYERGDDQRIPQEYIDDVSRMARESWGRAVTWSE